MKIPRETTKVTLGGIPAGVQGEIFEEITEKISEEIP